MKKKRNLGYSSLKKIFIYFSSFILIIIILNYLIAITWSPIKNFYLKNISKKEYFSEEILKSIGIEKEDQIEFYEEMWLKRDLRYSQFTEYTEGEKVGQKYVNLNEENGRKIENNTNCNINIFFYGGSNTFGYNVADDKTIPAYFKKLLNDNSMYNYCVYNFGSASFYSLRENSILTKHILEDKNKKNDYSIFLNGNNERINNDSVTLHLKKIFSIVNKSLWHQLLISSQNFIYSLPMFKFYKKIKYKNTNANENQDFQQDFDIIELQNSDLKLLRNNFEKNLKIRKGICDSMELRCYTFIEPFPYIHGKMPKEFNDEDIKEIFNKKYLLFSKLNGVIDITNAFDNITEISYVDEGHFAPIANEALAKIIYKNIFSDSNK